MGWEDGEGSVNVQPFLVQRYGGGYPESCMCYKMQGQKEGAFAHDCLPVLPHTLLHPASVLSGFECVFCNFVCKTKNMFERHLQIHLITRMFECDVCHKFMKTPEQLLEHKKCHTVPTGGLK